MAMEVKKEKLSVDTLSRSQLPVTDKKTLQPMHKKELLWNNIFSGLRSPVNMWRLSDRKADVLIPTLFTAAFLLPTFLFFAPAKTIFDIVTRKPLPQSTIDTTARKLSEFSNEQFNQVIEHIYDIYSLSSTSSNSSRKLINEISGKPTQHQQSLRAILNYLQDSKNTGKKLQHLIVDAVADVVAASEKRYCK